MGTAYDIAGKGIANAGAMKNAFELACKMGLAARHADSRLSAAAVLSRAGRSRKISRIREAAAADRRIQQFDADPGGVSKPAPRSRHN